MDYVYCPCPVLNCKNKAVSYWYRNRCGQKTKIRYSDINVICSGCNHSGILFDWKWSCGEHGYLPASKQGCIFALAILGQQYGNEDQIRQATMKLLQLWPS